MPSTVTVPELALFAVDETDWDPVMTRVSNPPAPPSIWPESAPAAETTNVSLLFDAPVRFWNPLNERPATCPAF